MQIIFHRTVLFTALISLLLIASTSRSLAQQAIPGSGWSDPLNLSESLTSSSSPTIIADPFGFVHVFWVEDLDGSPYLEGQGGKIGNAIVYRQLKGNLWSEMIDIFYAGRNGRLDNPTPFVDSDGVLNLIWIDLNGLWYSYAPAWSANQIRSWAPPVLLKSGIFADAKLIEVEDHVFVFTSLVSGDSSGIYMIRLDERQPVSDELIWQASSGTAPQFLSVDIDRLGRIHMTWGVNRPPFTGAVEVWYASSDDYTYFTKRIVSRSNSESNSEEDSLQFAHPWVGFRGENEVHLIWIQGDKTYRWHQYSMDSGENWSPPYQIWPDLYSATGSQAKSVASNNLLYWLDVLRYPNGIYMTSWDGMQWQRPEMIYAIEQEGNRLNVHRLRMVISQGNQLHVVFIDEQRAEIWYMMKDLPTNPVDTQILPTPASTPTLPPSTESAGLETGEDSTPNQSLPLAGSLTNETAGLPLGPGLIVLAGILPVSLIYAILAFLRFKKAG